MTTQHFEVYTQANSMMGFGIKKLNKNLFIEPSGLVIIKGSPYEKVFEFFLRNVYQILVSQTNQKETTKSVHKVTFNFFVLLNQLLTIIYRRRSISHWNYSLKRTVNVSASQRYVKTSTSKKPSVPPSKRTNREGEEESCLQLSRAS